MILIPSIDLRGGRCVRLFKGALQITGRPFAEAQVFRAGRAFEAAGEWRVAPTFKNRPCSAEVVPPP